MIDDAQVGQRLLIDDGSVRLLVTDKIGQGDNQRVVANVTVGGLVTSNKGVNMPDSASLSVPSLTEYDVACVAWAVEHEIDFLALSFVRKAEDLRMLKLLLPVRAANHASYIPVIAKIEKPQALDDLDAIVSEADGVMVARGDLGVEMDLAEVPGIQKRVISLCHDHGKPVIVATQMLQSMIDSPSPTRAEASDVANAIYDGADAVMLSGETAVGKYPVQVVATMARIALCTQRLLRERPPGKPPIRLQQTRYRTAALAHGVSVIVRDLDARLVATWSELGGGARYLSQNRLDIPIIAASSNPEALRTPNEPALRRAVPRPHGPPGRQRPCPPQHRRPHPRAGLGARGRRDRRRQGRADRHPGRHQRTADPLPRRRHAGPLAREDLKRSPILGRRPARVAMSAPLPPLGPFWT